jgi:hypothetical protein
MSSTLGQTASHAPEPTNTQRAEDLLGGLGERLREATQILAELDRLRAAVTVAASGQAPPSELLERIRSLEEDRDDLSKHLVEAQKQGSRVMNLYIVAYQLHATLEVEEVEATIGEIATDLLGAESFVLLLREDTSDLVRVTSARGLELTEVAALFTGPLYHGGHALADETLSQGRLYACDSLDEPTIAAVPLTIQGRVIGALLIFRLFSHRSRALAEEREMLDLVAVHSASALVAARAYSAAARKLRTLEGLMTLLGASDSDGGDA